MSWKPSSQLQVLDWCGASLSIDWLELVSLGLTDTNDPDTVLFSKGIKELREIHKERNRHLVHP